MDTWVYRKTSVFKSGDRSNTFHVSKLDCVKHRQVGVCWVMSLFSKGKNVNTGPPGSSRSLTAMRTGLRKPWCALRLLRGWQRQRPGLAAWETLCEEVMVVQKLGLRFLCGILEWKRPNAVSRASEGQVSLGPASAWANRVTYCLGYGEPIFDF